MPKATNQRIGFRRLLFPSAGVWLPHTWLLRLWIKNDTVVRNIHSSPNPMYMRLCRSCGRDDYRFNKSIPKHLPGPWPSTYYLSVHIIQFPVNAKQHLATHGFPLSIVSLVPAFLLPTLSQFLSHLASWPASLAVQATTASQ